MGRWVVGVAVVAGMLLAGCAGSRFEHQESTYRIKDYPKEGRLTVKPTMGGRIWGSASQDADAMEAHRRAAERFLIESGRLCTVPPGRPLRRSGWEFNYHC